MNAKDNTDFSALSQRYLLGAYGDPRATGWQYRWMTLWEVGKEFPWFPKSRIYIHKDFQRVLRGAFAALVRQGLHKEIKTCDGSYNLRKLRGSFSVLSVHAWGCAIDLNARQNPMGSEGQWSAEFIAVMAEHRVFCGQLWEGRKDPMHFALVNG